MWAIVLYNGLVGLRNQVLNGWQQIDVQLKRRHDLIPNAELTRNPLALASALEKIERAHAPTTSVKRGTAHLCIADPLGRAIGFRHGWLPDLLASHSPMAGRITALRQMAFQQ